MFLKGTVGAVKGMTPWEVTWGSGRGRGRKGLWLEVGSDV